MVRHTRVEQTSFDVQARDGYLLALPATVLIYSYAANPLC